MTAALDALLDRTLASGVTSSMELERLSFYDFVQYSYTDDGHGDGKLAAKNLDGLPTAVPTGSAAAALSLFASSRAETVAAYDEIMDEADRRAHTPWHEWPDEDISFDHIDARARRGRKRDQAGRRVGGVIRPLGLRRTVKGNLHAGKNRL